jgi:hypothetical protein
VSNIALAASSARTISVPPAYTAAAAIIEFAGGAVVASHSIWEPTHRAAAAACSHTAAGDLLLPHLRTLNARSSVSLFNPGSADADVSVTILVDGRVLTPERLTRRVVPPHGRRDFSLGDFAFNGNDVTAVVHVGAGSVVAEALVRTPAGVDAIEGVAASSSAIAISGASGASTSVSFADGATDSAGPDIRLITTSSQGSASVPPAIGGQTALRRAIPGSGGPAGFAIQSAVGPGVVAATSWRVRSTRGQDVASLACVQPSTQWGGVIGVVLPGAQVGAIVVNPGTDAATIHLHRIGPAGSSDVDEVIEGGRLLRIGLGTTKGTYAVSVRSSVPVGVALVANAVVAQKPRVVVPGLAAIAVDGAPLGPPPPVAVIQDQRAGVPAVQAQ